VAGGIRRGTAANVGGGRHWDGAAKPVGVFDAKADAIAVLEACGRTGRPAVISSAARRTGIIPAAPA
jgi:phenylalanyl-tRNA synthetase beta subunit